MILFLSLAIYYNDLIAQAARHPEIYSNGTLFTISLLSEAYV